MEQCSSGQHGESRSMAWLMLPYEGVNGTNSTTTPLITTGRVPRSFGQSSKIAGSSARAGTRDGGNHRRRGLHRTDTPLLAKLPTVIDVTPGTSAEPQDA